MAATCIEAFGTFGNTLPENTRVYLQDIIETTQCIEARKLDLLAVPASKRLTRLEDLRDKDGKPGEVDMVDKNTTAPVTLHIGSFAHPDKSETRVIHINHTTARTALTQKQLEEIMKHIDVCSTKEKDVILFTNVHYWSAVTLGYVLSLKIGIRVRVKWYYKTTATAAPEMVAGYELPYYLRWTAYTSKANCVELSTMLDFHTEVATHRNATSTAK